VSSQRARYRKVPDIRVRPVNEMDVCLVYTPSDPKLYTLNPTAWLVMELCDGRAWRSLERRYYAAIEPLRSREAAKIELEQAVNDLLDMGIVEIATNHPVAEENRGRAGRRHGNGTQRHN
jgi:hypothetical protein